MAATNNPRSARFSLSKPPSSSSSNPTPTPNPNPTSSIAKPTSLSMSTSTPSSLSSHLAMMELKQRILTSLSKLSDRDTHQIGLEELQSTISTLSPDTLPMLLNCLYDASSDPKPSLKKDSLRLLACAASALPDPAASHLPRILSHVARRLKDPDSSVRDACGDAVASLASLYLRPDGEALPLFLRPLFDAMADQNKPVQAAASACLAKMLDSAPRPPPLPAFQKLCPRICKCLANPNFLAKAAALSVVSSLSQVGAIAPQNLPALMQCIHGCLENSDWATRKAAADTLSVMATHSSHLVADNCASTIAALEACRFDRVKPVRDSMIEALQQWKQIAGKEDGVVEDKKAVFHDGKDSESAASTEKLESKRTNPSDKKSESSGKDRSNSTSQMADDTPKVKGSSMSDKAVGILKKKAPSLSDKELNPEFFQKLETRVSGDLPVEVVLPRRCLQSNSQRDESELNGASSRDMPNNTEVPGIEPSDVYGSARRADMYGSKPQDVDDFFSKKGTAQDMENYARERGFRGKDPKARILDADDRIDSSQRDISGARGGTSRSDGHSEGHKGNWIAIQRQLSQLERQQANLMAMLQDFMGGSHDSMVTLENRVRGLERIVEDMARDLAISSGRRGGNLMMGFEGASSRNLSKYNGLPDYSASKLGRGGDGRLPFSERFLQSDGIASGARGIDFSRRSDVSDAWDSYGYGAGRNGLVNSRRTSGSGSNDCRLPRTELDGDQVGSRRAWDKGSGPRLGEGPSARSVWQASKDEATLEAIRGSGEDNGTSRSTTRVAMPELNAEALTDENPGQERGRLWAAWSHAMDSLHVGDMDSAYAEVLSTGDDILLIKLMDRSGPVVDQLSIEMVSEVLHALGQFLLDQNLVDIALSWIQQFMDIVMENGPDSVDLPMEIKRELLVSLHEASALDLPEEWEGATSDQILFQLASAWGIDLQQFDK